MRRLQCDVCGEKSEPVGEVLSPDDRITLAAFKGQHDNCRARSFISTRPLAQVGPFGAEKGAPKAVRQAHGHFEITGPYGERQEGDTVSCCHCQKVWEVRIGSGIERGWCQNCMGYVCGPNCYECVPAEQRLENIEAGIPLLTPRAPSILVPASHLFPELSDAVR